MYPTEPNGDGELNCFSLSSSPEASKRRAGKLLKEVFESEEFKARFGSNAAISLELWLGSHSLRKSAATHARKNGCSRDEVDLRGRWKKRKRQVDTYIDTEIPFPDAKVAASLCVGGPVAYLFVPESGVDDSWVLDNVVPNISKSHFCRKTAARLGRAVFWACLDPLYKSYVPDELLKRVTSSYEQVRYLEPDINPVKKVGLVVVGNEGQLFIDLLPDADGDQYNDEQPGAGDVRETNYRRRRQSAELQAVFSQLAAIRRQNELIQTDIDLTRTNLMNKMQKLIDSVNRLAIPAQFCQSNTNTNNSLNNYPIFNNSTTDTPRKKARSNATLCRNPKSLYILWQEYEFGIGGRKAAKCFNREEQGANRYSF